MTDRVKVTFGLIKCLSDHNSGFSRATGSPEAAVHILRTDLALSQETEHLLAQARRKQAVPFPAYVILPPLKTKEM